MKMISKALLVATLISCSFASGIAQNTPPKAETAAVLSPGMNAPAFSLLNVDGKTYSLNNAGTKGAIIIFTCNHCPYAQAYEQRIIELHKKYEAIGFPVIAINSNDSLIVPDDSYTAMQSRAREKSYPFIYLYDPAQKTARAYGARSTPQVFLFMKEKDNLVLKYTGAIDDNADDPEAVVHSWVEEAIATLLEGKNPQPAVTKAVGCSIKWTKS